MLITSIENTAAAIGVPNRAAKAPLMPHMTAIFISFSSRRITLPIWFPMLPPNWRAAPSRPEEPPLIWVRSVPRKTAGAVPKVISVPEWIDSITIFVPRFLSSFKIW